MQAVDVLAEAERHLVGTHVYGAIFGSTTCLERGRFAGPASLYAPARKPPSVAPRSASSCSVFFLRFHISACGTAMCAMMEAPAQKPCCASSSAVFRAPADAHVACPGAQRHSSPVTTWSNPKKGEPRTQTPVHRLPPSKRTVHACIRGFFVSQPPKPRAPNFALNRPLPPYPRSSSAHRALQRETVSTIVAFSPLWSTLQAASISKLLFPLVHDSLEGVRRLRDSIHEL